MPVQLKVKTEGLRDLAGHFAKLADKDLVNIRREELRELGKQIVVQMREEAPKDTGRLQQSIGYRTDLDQHGMTLTVYVGADYAKYVQSGTRPHWVPAAALEGWAARHGINVFALQKSIATRGTSVRALDKYGTFANAFHERALAKSRDDIDVTARRIGQRVAEAVTKWVAPRVE